MRSGGVINREIKVNRASERCEVGVSEAGGRDVGKELENANAPMRGLSTKKSIPFVGQRLAKRIIKVIEGGMRSAVSLCIYIANESPN